MSRTSPRRLRQADMLRAAAQFAAYTVLALAPVLGIHAIAYALVPEPSLTRVSAPMPCTTEDSVKCFWDASEQGNGLGEDLWN